MINSMTISETNLFQVDYGDDTWKKEEINLKILNVDLKRKRLKYKEM